MEPVILTGIAGMLAKLENIALVVSMLVNIALGWAHIVWRREERQDRTAMLETFNKLTEALHSVKNAISAITGRPIS